MTVRAFSGTLSRISGGGATVCWDPLTASATAVEAILVGDLVESEIAFVVRTAEEMQQFGKVLNSCKSYASSC